MPRADAGALAPRILSSLVMIPAALAAIWLGKPWFGLLVTLIAVGMAWEWSRLVGMASGSLANLAMLAVGGGSLLATTLAGPRIGLLGAIGGTILGYLLTARGERAVWAWTGLLWILAPTVAFVYLRDAEPDGRAITIWICAVVWATDIGAYAAGKTIGGPRLAPKISPKKTWAGLLGGMASAGLVGALAASFTESAAAVMLAAASAALAIVGQIGDIAESYAKRRFGAKDSSNLIPGHGGLLDRLDGMLAVVAVVAVARLVAGESIVTWR